MSRKNSNLLVPSPYLLFILLKGIYSSKLFEIAEKKILFLSKMLERKIKIIRANNNVKSTVTSS